MKELPIMLRLRYFVSLFLAAVFVLITIILPATMSTSGQSPTATAVGSGKPSKVRVTFKSGNLTLVGYLFKPDGDGPFPALIWNHGSEQDPASGMQFDTVAQIFVP